MFSSGKTSGFGQILRNYFNRDVLVVLLTAWAARFLFIWLMPPGIRSFDAFSWEAVAKILDQGGNPYQTTAFLNWPPFWLQIIFIISKMAGAYGVPFYRVLQGVLILAESAVIVLLIKLIREIIPGARIRALVILGIALNPAAIFMICQHCNFDVFVALWLLLFMLGMVRYNHSHDPGDWLFAALFLGLAILVKTVPLILIPMLAGGFHRSNGVFKMLGSVLVLGPVALGMSIIYVLSPVEVGANVLAYRSLGNFFGFSGLFHLAGLDALAECLHLLFYVALLVFLVGSWRIFYRAEMIGNRECVLYAGLAMACVPVFGPGYGMQYLYWFMPFLVATFAFFKGRWPWLVAIAGIIAAVTYIFEYGLVGGLGSYVINIYYYETFYAMGRSGAPVWLLKLSSKCESPGTQTLICLPLFLSYLVLIFAGARIFFQNLRQQSTEAGTMAG